MTKAVPILVYESMRCLSASAGSASQMPGNYFKVKTKQKNKVFGCGEDTVEVVLKVVALVELVALVKPLSVGRVVPSCGGTKVNDNRKMSSGNSSKSQHNTTQHNREKTRTIHTANCNTTGKRQQHNTQLIATQHDTTQHNRHNMTKLQPDMK